MNNIKEDAVMIWKLKAGYGYLVRYPHPVTEWVLRVFDTLPEALEFITDYFTEGET